MLVNRQEISSEEITDRILIGIVHPSETTYQFYRKKYHFGHCAALAAAEA